MEYESGRSVYPAEYVKRVEQEIELRTSLQENLAEARKILKRDLKKGSTQKVDIEFLDDDQRAFIEQRPDMQTFLDITSIFLEHCKLQIEINDITHKKYLAIMKQNKEQLD